jgi:hypothetical protein
LGGPAPRVPAWEDAAPSNVSATQTRRAPSPAPVPAPGAPASAGEPSRRLALVVLAVAAASLMVGAFLFVSMRPPPAAGPEPRAADPSASPIAAASPEPGSPVPSVPAASPSTVPETAAPQPLTSPVMAEPAAPSPRPVSPPSPQTGAGAAPDPGSGGDAARLARANDLYERGRYAAALAEARMVLRRNPGNAEARTLVEDAEAAVVVEERIKKAREALRQGDREKALQEAKAGLAVAPSDARLLALFKEATR